MNLEQEVLRIVINQPGTSKEHLLKLFSLSGYRLNRVFRILQRNLDGQLLIHDDACGVWLIKINVERCTGVEWCGADNGGYRQCKESPQFPDNRCYFHSEYENPEIIAFERNLRYLLGVGRPNAHLVAQLGRESVEDLAKEIDAICPRTLRDVAVKKNFAKMIRAALAILTWKERRRQRPDFDWIPPEYFQRHKMASANPFEFALKKLFFILEVEVGATREEVLKAWRKLARRYHPDNEDGDEERMKAINLAKERIFRIKRWG